MLMNNLYEYFGCENKEELLELVQNNDPRISELIELYDKAKERIENNGIVIDSPKNLFKYFNENCDNTKLGIDTIKILSCDSKGKVIKELDISKEAEFKEIFKLSVAKQTDSLFFISSENNINLLNTLKANFKTLGIDVYDYLVYDDNDNVKSFNDRSERLLGKVDRTNNRKEKSIDKNIISKLPKYNEFTDYYISNKLSSLNVIKNEEEIKNLLKIGYQEKNQEHFGLIIFDKNKNILKNEVLFKGGLSSSIVDLKILSRKLLDDNIAGFQVYHNHPSGNTNPSNEDKEVTTKLLELAKLLNVDFREHYIVAKENVAELSNLIPELKEAKSSINLANNNLIDELKRLEDTEIDIKGLNKHHAEVLTKLKNVILKGGFTYDSGFVNNFDQINNSTGKVYSGTNQVLLAISSMENKYKSNEWLTFNQMKTINKSLQKENHLRLKKGSSGEPIFKKGVYDKELKREITASEFYNLSEEERNRKLENKIIYSFNKVFYVFNGDCFENFPGKEIVKPKITDIDISFIKNIAKEMDLTVKIQQTNKPHYNFVKDEVVLPAEQQWKTKEAFQLTSLHELSHATGHESRLNRSLNEINKFASEKYAKEEITAEIATLFTLSKFNIKEEVVMKESSADYITSWATKLIENPKEIIQAINDASKVSDYLTEKINKVLEKNKNIEKEKVGKVSFKIEPKKQMIIDADKNTEIKLNKIKRNDMER